tara:strand:- start:693 stop:1958 length:1266 start_codon:yes stop_codon:yes gene_type:complete
MSVLEAQPADPTKPCPFASLPDDLWECVSAHLIDTNSTDFVICTSTTVNKNQKLPLVPFDGGAAVDYVVRGIPCNGDLYILEVPQEPEVFLGEHKVLDHDTVYKDASDNGEWYSHIQRDDQGLVDYAATPTHKGGHGLASRGRHRFFKDTDGAVMLHVGSQEADVLSERHRCDEIEITGADAYGQVGIFHNNLSVRHNAVADDSRYRYMPIPHAHAGSKTGRLTLMSLCKGLKIRAKITTKGKLPMLTRLSVWNPNDQYTNMTKPFDIQSQMNYTHDKWLALVPLKWIAAQQSNDHKDLKAMAPSTRPIPTRKELLLEHAAVGSHQYEYKGTSFQSIARALVFAFFSTQSRFVNLFSDSETIELLHHAKNKPLFKTEFGLTGPHVMPAKAGESLRVSKSSKSVSEFNSPELDLLGEFAGVF